VKHTKPVLRMGRKASRKKKCEHKEAFAVAIFQDNERDSSYLILDCPDCGDTLFLVGALVKHIGA